MKNFGIILSVVVAIFFVFKQQYSLSLAETKAMLMEIENKILQDQIYDVVTSVSLKKTYEQGLKEGFENKSDDNFVRGYHYASEQLQHTQTNQLTTSNK